MDKRVEAIADIMSAFTTKMLPIIEQAWKVFGFAKQVKITIFVSVDGGKGNLMFTNHQGDPWAHQERIAREMQENKEEKGKTMVETKQFKKIDLEGQ